MMKLEITPRDKKIVTYLLPVLIIGVFSWYFLFPQVREYVSTKKAISETRENIVQLNAANKRMEKGLQSQEETRVQHAAASKKFSHIMQDGLFIVNLDRKLVAENVGLTVFRPMDIQDKEFYYILPVEVVLKGDYNSIIAVIDFLENQANLTELREIAFEAVKPEVSGDSPINILARGDVTAKFVLMIFSGHSPEGRLSLEDIKNWTFGRENPFKETANPRPRPKPVLPPVYFPLQSGSNPSPGWLLQETTGEPEIKLYLPNYQ